MIRCYEGTTGSPGCYPDRAINDETQEDNKKDPWTAVENAAFLDTSTSLGNM